MRAESHACRLSGEQQDKLRAWITETLPRNTRAIGAWIERECSIEYQGRSGLIALLHRLGMEHRKPKQVLRKLDGLDPEAYLAHVIGQLARGYLASRLSELLPWNCKDALAAKAA